MLLILVINQVIPRKFNNLKDNYCLSNFTTNSHISTVWMTLLYPIMQTVWPFVNCQCLNHRNSGAGIPHEEGSKRQARQAREDAGWRPQTVNENAKDG